MSLRPTLAGYVIDSMRRSHVLSDGEFDAGIVHALETLKANIDIHGENVSVDELVADSDFAGPEDSEFMQGVRYGFAEFAGAYNHHVGTEDALMESMGVVG